MKISQRGQISIPKKLRAKYGLFPEIEVELISKKGGLLIKKKTSHTCPVREVYGILKKGGKTDQYIEEIRGR